MAEPCILDDSNNYFNFVTDSGEHRTGLLPPTDHVICSIWYNAGIVAGGSIIVHLYLCRLTELNKRFRIPEFYGTFKRPYDAQSTEIAPTRAEFLIKTVINAFMSKQNKIKK